MLPSLSGHHLIKMIKIDILQQRQRDNMILKHKKIFAINMWEWPSQCPHCNETVKQWVDAECIFYNGMCWACFMEHEMSRQHEQQQDWEKLQMQDRYDKHRAENSISAFQLMSGQDIYDQGLQDSAGFGYITLILEDGTSGNADWCIPTIPNLKMWGHYDWQSDNYYVSTLDLSQRVNQEKLVRWLRPSALKGIEGMTKIYKSMSLVENMKNYFGESEMEAALLSHSQSHLQDLEQEYFDTVEYKIFSGISPVKTIQVDTLFGSIHLKGRGADGSGGRRFDLKPPIEIQLQDGPNYQSINNKYVRYK